ncbi:hypothetical protein SUGI_0065570 [Cryptomeria japonica]|nr:hypothetical protein SUGI_0065570 [Cryptomeria japonica]
MATTEDAGIDAKTRDSGIQASGSKWDNNKYRRLSQPGRAPPRAFSRSVPYHSDSYTRHLEPVNSYIDEANRSYGAISGSKRPYSSLDDVQRYAESSLRHLRAHLDYDVGCASLYAGTVYGQMGPRDEEPQLRNNEKSLHDFVESKRATLWSKQWSRRPMVNSPYLPCFDQSFEAKSETQRLPPDRRRMRRSVEVFNNQAFAVAVDTGFRFPKQSFVTPTTKRHLDKTEGLMRRQPSFNTEMPIMIPMGRCEALLYSCINLVKALSDLREPEWRRRDMAVEEAFAALLVEKISEEFPTDFLLLFATATSAVSEITVNASIVDQLFGTQIITKTIDRVDFSIRPLTVNAEKLEVQANTVIIATGVVAKRLDFPDAGEGVGVLIFALKEDTYVYSVDCCTILMSDKVFSSLLQHEPM